MAKAKRYSKAGQATFTHKTDGRQYVIAWSAGYPPVDVPAHLFDAPVAEFTLDGDDPAQGLEDAPDSEDAAAP